MNNPMHPDPACGPLPFGVRGRYQLPDSSMTLREGLAEYYRVNPGLSEPASLQNPRGATYFHNHDCTHVIFGTHTGPLDEGVNDLWTWFAVDIPYWQYVRGFMTSGEAPKIAKSYRAWHTFGQTIRCFRLLRPIRRRARAMTKKWPWNPPKALLDRPLDQIRHEYGIRVIHPEIEIKR